MSLHPTKKSDMGKAWLSKRIDRVKKIQPEYHLIVTEGKKTEPKYFGAIRDLINSRYREKIHLEIYGEGDNTISLFEKAKMRAENDPNGCKHVWVVYDKDDFPPEHFDTTAELCKQSSNDRTTYHAIWSNQCMELWYLLHFDYLHSDICRAEYYPKLSQRLKRLSAGEYKKNRTDMFEVLRPYTQTAIRHAKMLHRDNRGKKPSESAPGTMVFELIEMLLPYIEEESV